MTDKEIIFSLECCNAEYNECEKCPFKNKAYCERHIIENAFDLINRQQAEIERLESLVKTYDIEIDELNNFANERLDKFIERYDRNLRAEAIKEFADRILSYIDVGHLRPPTEICFSDLDVKQIVEKIAKEMVGTEK